MLSVVEEVVVIQVYGMCDIEVEGVGMEGWDSAGV